MLSVKQRLILRAASLTAFLRFEVGLVQDREPQEADPAAEKKLRKQVKELQSALSDSQKRLDKAHWRLRIPALSMPRRWRWAAYFVSDKHQFVFLAPHKVATTSILISLLPLFAFEDVEAEDFDNLSGARPSSATMYESVTYISCSSAKVSRSARHSSWPRWGTST